MLRFSSKFLKQHMLWPCIYLTRLCPFACTRCSHSVFSSIPFVFNLCQTNVELSLQQMPLMQQRRLRSLQRSYLFVHRGRIVLLFLLPTWDRVSPALERKLENRCRCRAGSLTCAPSASIFNCAPSTVPAMVMDAMAPVRTTDRALKKLIVGPEQG